MKGCFFMSVFTAFIVTEILLIYGIIIFRLARFIGSRVFKLSSIFKNVAQLKTKFKT